MRPDMMPGAFFPAVPDPYASRLMAVLYQMDQSQWLTDEELRSRQHKQLALLLRHAWETSPGYRLRLEAAGYDPDRPASLTWSSIPILTRSDLQQGYASFVSTAVPQSHGATFKVESSGSTGKPVQSLGTELTRFFWQATTLREHFWHHRDFSRSLFSIRPDRGSRNGIVSHPGWGPPVDILMSSGKTWLMHSSCAVEEQFDRLCEAQPDYLMTLPSNLRELSFLAAERKTRPVGIEIRTFGESVSDELRRLVWESFGVPLIDVYSASETGYLALQCPLGDGCYHINAETVLLEVLDDDGMLCQPGDIGRVVVSVLHNFALPLIRYEVGDYAEVGGPCSCGRGLPVLTRILGRVRGMAVKPDGSHFWPSFPGETWMHVAPIKQLQLIQTGRDQIEVIFAMERELSDEEEHRLTGTLQTTLGFPYRMICRRVGQIPRSPNGKFEDFISRIDD